MPCRVSLLEAPVTGPSFVVMDSNIHAEVGTDKSWYTLVSATSRPDTRVYSIRHGWHGERKNKCTQPECATSTTHIIATKHVKANPYWVQVNSTLLLLLQYKSKENQKHCLCLPSLIPSTTSMLL